MKYFLWYILLGAVGAIIMHSTSIFNKKEQNSMNLMVENSAKRTNMEYATPFIYALVIIVFLLGMGQYCLFIELKVWIMRPFKILYRLNLRKKIKQEYLKRNPEASVEEALEYAKLVLVRQKKIKKAKIEKFVDRMEDGEIEYYLKNKDKLK